MQTIADERERGEKEERKKKKEREELIKNCSERETNETLHWLIDAIGQEKYQLASQDGTHWCIVFGVLFSDWRVLLCVHKQSM